MLTKFVRICLCLALVALFAQSCSERPSSVGFDPAQSQLASLWAPPAGATFQSAALYIYVSQPSNMQVTVYRVESDWDETLVTWGNFGGAYNASVEGSFLADDIGWRSADISGLVSGWLNGTYDNYGLLIDQPTVYYALAIYPSREAAANQPYIEICYDLNGSTVCENVPVDADAYIRELYPDQTHGTLDFLGTGWGAQIYLEKQSLLRVDFEPAPQPAAIGDRVWDDQNQNGIQDGGELGIEGVTVNLYNCGDGMVATTVTDADGLYHFVGLTPGDYFVEFVVPSGWTVSPQDQGGDDTMDSDADQSTGRTACTTLDPGETDNTWDAGLYQELVYGECEGKVTQLTLRYDGSIVDAHIVVLQKKNVVAFDGIVQPGDQFTFYGMDRHGTFGPETYYYVNGVLNTNIHTSCSQLIGPGLTSGDFTVIEGYSRHGGLLPPI